MYFIKIICFSYILQIEDKFMVYAPHLNLATSKLWCWSIDWIGLILLGFSSLSSKHLCVFYVHGAIIR